MAGHRQVIIRISKGNQNIVVLATFSEFWGFKMCSIVHKSSANELWSNVCATDVFLGLNAVKLIFSDRSGPNDVYQLLMIPVRHTQGPPYPGSATQVSL